MAPTKKGVGAGMPTADQGGGGGTDREGGSNCWEEGFADGEEVGPHVQ
jgi:hypothetical protein